MILKLEKVEKFFPEKDIFRGINLQVNRGEKIGLIGENGSGKSVLLKIISGEITPERGEIFIKNGLKIGNISQEFSGNLDETVYENLLNSLNYLNRLSDRIKLLEVEISKNPDEKLLKEHGELLEKFSNLGGYELNSIIRKALAGIGFKEEELWKKCKNLSGGELLRVELTKLLLGDYDLLLLDEPTNYLDIKGINFLENFLKNYKKTFILITHDRYFLERVVDKIWEIENKRVNVYCGNFDFYRKEKKKRFELQLKEYEKQQKFIEKSKIFIEKNIYGENHKQAQSRKKMLEKMVLIEKPVNSERNYSFKFNETEMIPSPILKISKLKAGYSCPIISMEFEELFLPTDIVGIIGDNGSGKTTFFKTLLGILKPLEGNFEWNRNVKIEYLDQFLDGVKLSPIKEIRRIKPRWDDTEIRKYLGKFGFTGEEVFKDVEKLSGGEKNKLLLATISLKKSNVLLLDEPTNHLDIYLREALEVAIKKYRGLVMVISHDRYFLDRTVNKIIFIKNGIAQIFYGNYSENEKNFLEILSEGKDREKNILKRKKSKKRGISKNEKMRITREIEKKEEEIIKSEDEIKKIEEILSKRGNSLTPVDFKKLTETLEKHREIIEKLFDELDQLNKKLNM